MRGRVNYLFQRHVTGSFPRAQSSFEGQVWEAARHLRIQQEYSSAPLGEAIFYEFGAGWDLIGPLTYWSLGVDHQILVDIRRNLSSELVRDTRRRLAACLEGHSERLGLPVRELPSLDVEDPRRLDALGIRYMAPCDARSVAMPPGSVDFVSSTYTLEHIPRDDIAAILRESRRLLRRDGLISCAIDLKDHYAYVDSSIGPYNFLKFGDRTWTAINSSLQYLNRLRVSDYVELLEEAGFSIVELDTDHASEEDMRALRSMKLAPRFREGYERADLATTDVFAVARAAG